MVVTSFCTKRNSCNICKIVHPVFTGCIRMRPLLNIENYLLVKYKMWTRIASLVLLELHIYRSLVTVKDIMAMIRVYTCKCFNFSESQVKSCTWTFSYIYIYYTMTYMGKCFTCLFAEVDLDKAQH